MPKKVYKKVKKLVPFCSDCEEELGGNGSGFAPYHCRCGAWEWIMGATFKDGEYKIKE